MTKKIDFIRSAPAEPTSNGSVAVSGQLRIEVPIQARRDRWARNLVARQKTPKGKGSVPRLTRLLALAHKWEGMVRRGEVRDYVEIARLARLTRGRVTQICGLTLLAPDIQRTILGTRAHTLQGRVLRDLACRAVWVEQRDKSQSQPRGVG